MAFSALRLAPPHRHVPRTLPPHGRVPVMTQVHHFALSTCQLKNTLSLRHATLNKSDPV